MTANLVNQINGILDIISCYSIINHTNTIRNKFQRECICDNDLYSIKNRQIIIDIYILLQDRHQWESSVRINYADNLYYSKFRTNTTSVLNVVNELFIDINDIMKELDHII